MQSPPPLYTFKPMTEETAQQMMNWHYPKPYHIYDLSSDPETMAELLDRRSPHFGVFDQQHELIGFFAFGTSGRVVESAYEPGLYTGDRTLTTGLGLRPDLTGKSLGEGFVKAGLAFARQSFAPETFQFFVLSFNERAIKLYEKLGFHRVQTLLVHNRHGTNEFVEMHLKAWPLTVYGSRTFSDLPLQRARNGKRSSRSC